MKIAIFAKNTGIFTRKLNFSEISVLSGYFSKNLTFRHNGTSGHLKCFIIAVVFARGRKSCILAEIQGVSK